MIIAMLHILLLILKIIGITLGILLGVILLALCLALFVPLRYRIEAERTEGEGNPPVEVAAKVTWLLHFINVRLMYSTELKLRLRILFITIFRLPEKKKARKANKFKRNRKEKDKKTEKEYKWKAKEKSAVGENYDNKECHTAGKKDSNDDKASKSDEDTTKSEKRNNAEYAATEKNDSFAKDEPDKDEHLNRDAQPEKDGKSDKITDNENDRIGQHEDNEDDAEQKLSIKDKLIKIWKFFKNIWYTIKEICARMKEIFENIEYYLELIKSDTFKSAFALCKGELGSVFSYIKPRKFNADIVIGTGDPASTGQVISYYYGILYPLIGNHVIITGDFDNKRIEGSVFIKGKIKLFTVLKAALRIYFSKDIKKLLKLFKKEDE